MSAPAPTRIPRLLAISQAAAVLGVSKSMVRKLCRLDQLPTVNVGKRRLIAEDDLLSYVSAHRSGGTVLDLAAARAGR